MEIQAYSSIKKWLGRVAPSTAKQYLYMMGKYCDWAKENDPRFGEMTPDELVDFQKENKDYQILDSIQEFVNAEPRRYGYVSKKYKYLRSFFLHNRAELPRDPSFRMKTDRPRVVGDLSVAEVRDMIMSCDPVHHAVYLCMFQSAMDQEMFLYWNETGWDSLKKQLQQNAEIIKIDLPGRKMNRNKKPFYTFIGGDAVESIKNWIQHRPVTVILDGNEVSNPYIFVDQSKTQFTTSGLRRYWLRHLRKLGIIPLEKGEPHRSRTGKNPHELRDVYRSLWTKSGANNVVVEFLMGHGIDPLEYDKSFRDVPFYQEEYMKAEPYLNLLSSGAAFGRVEKNEVDKLKAEISELNGVVTELKSQKNPELEELQMQIAAMMPVFNAVKKQHEERERFERLRDQ